MSIAARPLVWLALAGLLTVPLLTDNEFYLILGISIALFAVLSTGLNLVYGYTGLLSFAQVGFFGIGAYTSALLVVNYGWTMWTGFIAGGLLARVLGLIIAYTSLRLSRHAFAIVSLSFALLCLIIARDWVTLTRGPMGIPGLPVPEAELPGLGLVSFGRPQTFYYVMVIFAIAANACMYRVIRSRVGRTLRAIKMNEPLARSQGVNPLKYKLIAIGLSALLTGMAGGIYVFHLTIVDPSIFDFYYTETMLIMVITGGPGSFWGVLAASAVFSVLPEILRFSTDLRLVMYGTVLIVAMLLLPRGIGGWLHKRRLARWRSR
jgi:branched-chain amino acid transport system permease protein